jgi:hypothetical protein
MLSLVRLLSIGATIAVCACASRPAAPVTDPATAIDIEVINESRGYVFIFNTFDVDTDCVGHRVHVPPNDKFERTSFQIDRRTHVTFSYAYVHGIDVSHSCGGAYTFPVEQKGRYQVRTVRYEKSCRVSVTKTEATGNSSIELIPRPARASLIGPGPRCVSDSRF